jgi:GTP-binding protein
VSANPTQNLRNIAIIAHVDHGKTTLVDQLLKQSGTFDARTVVPERVMDSNALEKERGITILAKNTAIKWNEYRINIVDTPGHADFGGEVERVLSMVDSVLLLVDAVDGPMPQTRFVTQKAFAHGLRPIVVINKIDRHEARPNWVLDQTFDLFDRLGATEEQLDFPVVYASAIQGFATFDPGHRGGDMKVLFETIIKHCSPPDVDPNGPLQLQVSQLDYSSYVGAIGIGRIKRGVIRRGQTVTVVDRTGHARTEKISQVLGFHGLNRMEVDSASAGDIVAFAGIEIPAVSDTLCDPIAPEALPPLVVDEPTIGMTFEVNTSPFAGVKASTSPAARSASDCSARRSPTSHCASRKPRTRTSTRSTAAANCTWACCSRTCAAKATRLRSRARAWSSRRSTASGTSRTKSWPSTSKTRARAP